MNAAHFTASRVKRKQGERDNRMSERTDWTRADGNVPVTIRCL